MPSSVETEPNLRNNVSGLESFEDIKKNKRPFLSMREDNRPSAHSHRSISIRSLAAGSEAIAFAMKKRYGGQDDQSDSDEERKR